MSILHFVFIFFIGSMFVQASSDSFKYDEFEEDWLKRPSSFHSMEGKTFFHRLKHEFKDHAQARKAMKVFQVMSLYTHASDFEGLKEDAYVLVMDQIKEILAKNKDEKDLNGEDIRAICAPTVLLANKKRIKNEVSVLEKNQQQASHAMDQRITALCNESPIHAKFSNGDSLSLEVMGLRMEALSSTIKEFPGDLVLRLLQTFPGGESSIFKAVPTDHGYVLNYDAVSRDPFAIDTEVWDDALIHHLQKLNFKELPMLRKDWETFMEQTEKDLYEADSDKNLDEKIIKDAQNVMKKLSSAVSDESFPLLLARISRIYESLQSRYGKAGAARMFYMGMAENSDEVGTRCIDGIHDWLNQHEQHHILHFLAKHGKYQEDENVSFEIIGQKISHMLRTFRYQIFSDMMKKKYQDANMEVQNYANLNAFRALQFPLGLSTTYHNTEYAFEMSSEVPELDTFIDIFFFGGWIHKNAITPYKPKTVAQFFRDSVGFGKTISPEVLETLIEQDLMLRSSFFEWRDHVWNGDDQFSNQYFDGMKAPHEALNDKGYLKILERFGYVKHNKKVSLANS